MTMQGADTDGLRKVGQDCQQGAQVAQEAIAFLTALVAALKAASFFTGGASAAYAEYLETVVIPWLKRIEEALQLFAKVLDGQAQSQDDASSTGTVTAGLPSYTTPALPSGDTNAYPVMQLTGSSTPATASTSSMPSTGSTTGSFDSAFGTSLGSSLGSSLSQMLNPTSTTGALGTGSASDTVTVPGLDQSGTGSDGSLYANGNGLDTSLFGTPGAGTVATGTDQSGLYQPVGLQDSGSTISDPVPSSSDTSTFGSGGGLGGSFAGLGTGSSGTDWSGLGSGGIGGTGGADGMGQTDTSGLGADTIGTDGTAGSGSVDGSALTGAGTDPGVGTDTSGSDTGAVYTDSSAGATPDTGTTDTGGANQTVTDATPSGHSYAAGGAAAALGVGGAGALAAAARSAGTPQDPAGWSSTYTSPNTNPAQVGTIRVNGKQVPTYDMAGQTPPATKPSGNLDSWVSDAKKVLADNGTDTSSMSDSDLRSLITHESSGKWNELNNWDSNARKGTPSKGLMQTIDPTFNSYSVPGHRDIWNPVDNIVAGVRYSVDKYGGFDKVPGIVALHNGKAYRGY